MFCFITTARLAQSVEHETLNLRVVGSSPTLGDLLFVQINICGTQFNLFSQPNKYF